MTTARLIQGPTEGVERGGPFLACPLSKHFALERLSTGLNREGIPIGVDFCWGGRPNGIQCANIGSNNEPNERAAQWNLSGFL